MSRRVSPTERIRAEIDELFASDRDLVEVLEEVARLGAPVDDPDRVGGRGDRVPGPGPLPARGERRGARPGCRNGYCPTTVKTTAGPVTLQRPKLRGTDRGVRLAAVRRRA